MEGNNLSLNISISGSPEQRHIGFEVIDQGNTLIYHLAFHCMFRKDTSEFYTLRIDPYLRVDLPNFSEHEKLHLSRHLEVIYTKSAGKIPYGFNYVPDSVLTAEGDVEKDLPAGSGLTCATFILQVLRSQSFDIIDLESWESRDEDKDWQSKILTMLKEKSSASKEHLEALEAHMGTAARFKPEEVAGCANAYDEEPIQFPEGIILGEKVYREMADKGLLQTA